MLALIDLHVLVTIREVDDESALGQFLDISYQELANVSVFLGNPEKG